MIVNGSWRAADADLAEEDRAGAVQANCDRGREEERREHDQPEERAADVHGALGQPVRRAEHRGRQPEQRRALERVDGGAAADDLEQARDDVDLDAQLVADADDVQAGLMICGKRQHDVVDVVGEEDVGQLVGRAQHREVGQLLVQLQRIGIDEAH